MMKLYVFADKRVTSQGSRLEQRTAQVLTDLACNSNTADLVVAMYLLRRRDFWQGHTYTGWVAPQEFTRVGKQWRFVERFSRPRDLPKRFQLIRMAFGMLATYPRTLTDVYDWELHCTRFEDLLAYTFAHELHHFRRHHLGLHPGEGEQAACRWALKRAAEAGYEVHGRKHPGEKRRRRPMENARLPAKANPDLLKRIKLSASHLCLDDLRELSAWTRERITAARPHKFSHRQRTMEDLRALPAGSPLLITHDTEGSPYLGQTAVKIRNLRRPSIRMVIKTADGKEWHWPMAWLRPVR